MVNLYKQKLTILQQGILRLLFIKAGKSLNQRQIAKILGVTPPAIVKAVPKLYEEELIKTDQDKESKRWSISLNSDNYKAVQLKRVDNLKQVYESGLADFLQEKFAGSTIILFGSYSRGEDIFNSDIDIAVIGRTKKDIDLSEFSKALEREISINFYDSFREIHKNLKENILNGIMLFGGVEL